jgi:hypothetical protein
VEIRIICAVISIVSVISLAGSIANAQQMRDSWSMEVLYFSQNGFLTPIQHKRFEGLPPDERERILRNFREYQKLPKNQKNKMKDNYRKWQKMSPEKRQKLQNIYKDYKRPKKRNGRRR